jgi:hypothetical protein
MPQTISRPVVRRVAVAAALSLLAIPAAAQQTSFAQGADAAAAASAGFAGSLGASSAPNLVGRTGSTIDFGSPFGVATLAGGALANGFVTVTGLGTAPALTLSFATAVTAFGATFSDVGSCCGGQPFPAGVLTFTFLSGATQVGAVTQQFATTGGLRNQPAFLGASGLAAFDRVEVRTNKGDQITMRGPVVGIGAATTPVSTAPEPGSLVLLAGGLVGLDATARARRTT